MNKAKSVYTCSECGGTSAKWLGKCPSCNAWNTLVESIAEAPGKNRFQSVVAAQPVATLSDIDATEVERQPTGIDELDRVLGGGIVAGGVVLIGGDPGIGKSTLLLQALDSLSRNLRTLYVTGEESGAQVALRSRRLGLDGSQVRVIAEIQLEKITATICLEQPAVCVIDSIQTVYSEQLTSAPGSVAQVRECAAQLTRTAKSSGVSIVLVGHVTKDGALAGPRVLEHIVDTVLYFEGEKHHSHRVVRAVKNRFGAVSELGVFEMTSTGLRAVPNPSKLFLAERLVNAPGSAVLCCVEGSRPMLVEIQALVSTSTYGNARRMTSGLDQNRLSLLLAVLEKRAGLNLVAEDVFVNVAGGIAVDEPAADLGIVAAVASSVRNRPVKPSTAVFGEVGLAGEVRGISQAALRVREAAQMGFTRCIVPQGNCAPDDTPAGCELVAVRNVSEALDALMDW